MAPCAPLPPPRANNLLENHTHSHFLGECLLVLSPWSRLWHSTRSLIHISFCTSQARLTSGGKRLKSFESLTSYGRPKTAVAKLTGNASAQQQTLRILCVQWRHQGLRRRKRRAQRRAWQLHHGPKLQLLFRRQGYPGRAQALHDRCSHRGRPCTQKLHVHLPCCRHRQCRYHDRWHSHRA